MNAACATSHCSGCATPRVRRAHADAQAQQLDAYRGEYIERWSARFREPGSVALMQCYQGFMQRLEQAITQQRSTAQQARARVDQARQTLTDNERRVASVQKLIERRAQQEQHRAARREQSHTDESRCARTRAGPPIRPPPKTPICRAEAPQRSATRHAGAPSMLPTTPIRASRRPRGQRRASRQRRSEPQSNDAFAQALQRAQGGEPAPAQRSAPHAPAPKPATRRSRAARLHSRNTDARRRRRHRRRGTCRREATRDATATSRSTDSTSGDAPPTAPSTRRKRVGDDHGRRTR